MLNNIVGVLGVGGGVATNFDSIATTTLNASTTNIDFTSISSSYKHLQIRGIIKSDRADLNEGLKLTFNNDTTTGNYNAHNIQGSGSAASAGNPGSSNGMLLHLVAGGNNGSAIFAGVIIDILDYASTNKAKTVRMLWGYDNNGNGHVGMASGLWTSTNAVTSVKLAPAYGTNWVQYTSLALYGIKA